MSKISRKNAFIVPFSQSGLNKVPQVTNEEQSNRCTNVDWSPVHIGRHTQSITPATKRKIKHRFACGLAAQYITTNEISPGFCVPVEFSQYSYTSELPDNLTEAVVCDDVEEVEFGPDVVEEQDDEKLTYNGNTNKGFELEIEYDGSYENILSREICDRSQETFYKSTHIENGNNANLTQTNKGQLVGTKILADDVHSVNISPSEALYWQDDPLDQMLCDTNICKDINKIQTNLLLVNEINSKTGDTVVKGLDEQTKFTSVNTVVEELDEQTKLTSVNTVVEELDEQTKLTSVNTDVEELDEQTKLTSVNTAENRKSQENASFIEKYILLPDMKEYRQNLKKKTKAKGTCRNKVTKKPNKFSINTDEMTMKPKMDGPLIDQCTVDGACSQVVLYNALKTCTNRSRRKCKTTTDTIKRDVLKTMLKLHEEILQLQCRRRQLMIDRDARKSSPFFPVNDVVDKIHLEGFIEE